MKLAYRIFLPLLGACLLTSCQLLSEKGFVIKANPSQDKVTTTDNKQTVPATASATQPVVQDSMPSSKPQPTTVEKPSVKGDKVAQPSSMTVQEAPKADQQVAKAEHHTKFENELDGDWLIVEAGNKKIDVEEDIPYVKFVEADGKFYAYNGCNVINGMYSCTNNSISFANVLTSLKACPNNPYEQSINVVIRDNNTVKASLEHKDGVTYLTLSSLSNANKVVLRRNILELIAGEWNVVEINDEKVEVPDVNIFFNTDDLTVHGNTGCNYFNGQIFADPLHPESISFSHMAVTMRMCPNSQLEMAMLVALEQASSYRTHGKHSMTLYDSKGKKVMTLHK